MSPSDPYPVLKMLQSHLEGRLRLGQKRLWLEPGAAECLREMVRMKPRPWTESQMAAAAASGPAPSAPEPAPKSAAAPTASNAAPETGAGTLAAAHSVVDRMPAEATSEVPPAARELEKVGHPEGVATKSEASRSDPAAPAQGPAAVATAAPLPVPVPVPVPVSETPTAGPVQAKQTAPSAEATQRVASEAPQRLTLPEAPDVKLTLREKIDRLSALRRRVEAKAALGGGGGSVVFSDGSPEADIAVVGAAPGGDEEWQGVPYVGPAGLLLAKVLKVMNLDRTKVYLTNVRKQRPAHPDTPVPAEELDWLREEMAVVRPKVIVVLGGDAIAGLLGLPADAEAARGRFYDFEGVPVMVTLDPVTLLAAESRGMAAANVEKRKLWEDMLQVMERAGMPVSAKQRAFFLPK